MQVAVVFVILLSLFVLKLIFDVQRFKHHGSTLDNEVVLDEHEDVMFHESFSEN